MSEAQTSKYWLDAAVADIKASHPKGEIIVSSGISPSASYHIGHFREVLTADALAWGLRQVGRRARHLHFVDNFDPLRKRYHFLPESFDRYVGWPICLVPDPFDCHPSYATHYAREFEQSAAQMGVQMEVILSYEQQYRSGQMAPMIEQALAQVPEIQRIFSTVAGRQLPPDWVPVQLLSDDNSFNDWRYDGIDTARKVICYRDQAGQPGELDYTAGRVKLNWRLDWPARWAQYGVQVEPYGREHATKGGSYDTGVEFVRRVFGAEPPYPLPYDTINLVGDTKKMSSSLGNLVTPAEALEIMPPEILRYFVLRSLPKRILYFDSGLGLYNLIDEYSKIEEAAAAGREHEFEQAYRVASAVSGQRVISSVPFSHLVAVYQAARGDLKAMMAILERTGYKPAVKQQHAVLEREAGYVKNWLAKYAPDSVKFAVQVKLPKVSLSDQQQHFLTLLADQIEAAAELDGPIMHDLIYQAKEAANVKPQEAFQAIYRVILGKDSGPKAGWFLASLDKGWLVERLRLKG
ncbi:MAG TPA: lysine--tRNA ligase [Candidatus Saccharimonadales bacterium]|nr:lysine--tRNA ligase [Candidatus Saccharimonadales bacterium]